MTDLSRILGLNVMLDEITGKLCFGDEVTCETEEQISLREIAPVLLNKFLKYPENVYTRHKNVCNGVVNHINDLTYDILHIPNGLLGIEFMRTHIYYSKPNTRKLDCVIEVNAGEITVILQLNDKNDPLSFNTNVKEISIVKLTQGDRLAVPKGVMYTFINTGVENAVLSIVTHKSHRKLDYSVLQREKGLAFFVISKNAKVEIVANPRYKVSQQPQYQSLNNLEEELRNKFLKDFIADVDSTLYETLQKNTKRFAEVIV